MNPTTERIVTDMACRLLWKLKAGRYEGWTDEELDLPDELPPPDTEDEVRIRELGFVGPVDEWALYPIIGSPGIGDPLQWIGDPISAKEWGVIAVEVARRIAGMTVGEFLDADAYKKIGLLNVAQKTPTVDAAKQPSRRKTGRPSKNEKDSATKVLAALAKHHGYDNGSVTNWEPATNRDLASEYQIAGNALTRFLCDKFGKGAHKQYAAKCKKREIGAMLMLWHGDLPTHDAPLRDGE